METFVESRRWKTDRRGADYHGLVVATSAEKNYEHDDQRPLFIIGAP